MCIAPFAFKIIQFCAANLKICAFCAVLRSAKFGLSLVKSEPRTQQWFIERNEQNNQIHPCHESFSSKTLYFLAKRMIKIIFLWSGLIKALMCIENTEHFCSVAEKKISWSAQVVASRPFAVPPVMSVSELLRPTDQQPTGGKGLGPRSWKFEFWKLFKPSTDEINVSGG